MRRYVPLVASIALLTAGLVPFHASAQSASKAVKTCGALSSVKPQDLYLQNPKLMHECMTLGWDPPVSWRPNKGIGAGIKAGAAGGFSYGVYRSPDSTIWQSVTQSSGAGGASNGGGPSSTGGIPGFPPSSSSGGSSSGGGSGGAACPTSNDDNDATYGVKQPMAVETGALECGAAAPLSTYQLSLSANADSLLITENGYFNYWIYKRTGNTYKLVSKAGAMLPNKLCDGGGNKKVDLQPPVAQMISFNSAASSLAVRLKSQTAATEDPLDPPKDPEKHFVVPLSGGNVNFSNDCPSEQQLQVTSAIGDIVFDTVMTGGCEAPPEICTANGIPPTPGALPDCKLAYNYPTGSACGKKIQVILLDRPNLIYPSGARPPTYDIEGMTAKMLGTVANTKLMTKDGWVVRFGNPGGSFVLPQGGTLGLADGTRLVMKGPATIAGNGQVTLKSGGTLQTKGGEVITTYKDNTNLTPNAIRPMVITVNQVVTMPEGYVFPSSPSAKLRLPVTTK